MTREEAKKLNAEKKAIYRAYCDGRKWSGGRMVDFGETIGYYETEEEARKACKDYELVDFDAKHCTTGVELCDDGEFND